MTDLRHLTVEWDRNPPKKPQREPLAVAQEMEGRLRSLFEAIERGHVQILAVGETWDEVWAGDVAFVAAGWRLTVFNDCDDVDYLDSCVTPEGEEWSFDRLSNASPDISLATIIREYDGIEARLKAAPAQKAVF